MKKVNIIFNNFWAKAITLILAVSTWFYVFDMVNSDSFSQKKETVEDVLLKYNFVVKEIPVKPVFLGKSPKGYSIPFDKVKVVPEKISVFGPEDMLEDITELETDRINLGEYTRSVQLNVNLKSPTRGLKMDDKSVDVFVPVVMVNGGK